MIANTRDPMIPCPDCKVLCGTKDAMLRDRRLYYRCTRCLKFFDVAAFIRSKENAVPNRKAQRLEKQSLASIFGDETPSVVIAMRDEVPLTAPSAVSPPSVLAAPARASNPPKPVLIAPRHGANGPDGAEAPVTEESAGQATTAADGNDDEYEAVSSSALDPAGPVTPFDVTPLVAIDPNRSMPSSRPDRLAVISRIGLLPEPPSPLSRPSELSSLPTPTRSRRVEELRLESVLGDVTPSLPQLVRATDLRKDVTSSRRRGLRRTSSRPSANGAGESADDRVEAANSAISSSVTWLAAPASEETPLIVDSELELGEEDFLPSSHERRSSRKRPSLDILGLPPLGVYTTSSVVPGPPSTPDSVGEPPPRALPPTAPPALLKTTSFTVYKSPPPKGPQSSQETVVIRRPSKLARKIAAGTAVALGLAATFTLAMTTLSATSKSREARAVSSASFEPPPSVAAPAAPQPPSIAMVRRIAPIAAPIAAPRPVETAQPPAVTSAAIVAPAVIISSESPPSPASAAAEKVVDALLDIKHAPARSAIAAEAARIPVAAPKPVASAPAGGSKFGVTAAEGLTAAADRAYRSGNAARADELYRKALALSPSFLPARLGVAAVAWDQGRRDEARARYRALVDDAPPGLPPFAHERAGRE